MGPGEQVVGTSEASRGHRDPAHGGGWKSLAAREPSLEDDPVHTLRAQADSSGTPSPLAPAAPRSCSSPASPGGEGEQTGDPPARQARGVPFPRPLPWIPPRRLRQRVAAGGGARAQEPGAAGAALTSTSAGGEGAGRGTGEEEEEEEEGGDCSGEEGLAQGSGPKWCLCAAGWPGADARETELSRTTLELPERRI